MAAAVAWALTVVPAAWAQSPAAGPLSPSGPGSDPMLLSADLIQQWSDAQTDYFLCRGNVFLSLGVLRGRAAQAVAWLDRAAAQDGLQQLTIYLEDQVTVERPGATIQDRQSLLRLSTRGAFRIYMREYRRDSGAGDPLVLRAEAVRRGPVPTTLPAPATAARRLARPPEVPPPRQRLRIYPRTDKGFTSESFPGETSDERVTVLTGGVNLLVVKTTVPEDVLDIAADRMVVWSRRRSILDLDRAGPDQEEEHVEVYLEGDVVVLSPEQKIRCERMYYDLREGLGVFVETEIETQDKRSGLNIYLTGRKFRQVARWQKQVDTQEVRYSKFYGDQAAVTSSTFRGYPSYQFRMMQVVFEHETITELEPDPQDPTGRRRRPKTYPGTQIPVEQVSKPITGLHDVLLVEEKVPVFYWPVMHTDLQILEGPLRRVRFTHSDEYGTGVETDWNLLRLLNVKPEPRDVDLMMDLDYYGDRGPAIGFTGEYKQDGIAPPAFLRDGLADLATGQRFWPGLAQWGEELRDGRGRYWGFLESYFVRDTGEDDLGGSRNDLEPEKADRGWFLWRHKQELPGDLTVQAEVSWISDENFLEEWREDTFDTDKNQETLLYVKQQRDIWAWWLLAKVHINDFNTETESLPAIGYERLGQSLLKDTLTFFDSSQVGYLRYNASDRREYETTASVDPVTGETTYTPTTLGDLVNSDFSGLRADSRNELDWPLALGPAKVVPFVVGRVSYWEEAMEHRPDYSTEGLVTDAARFDPVSRTRWYGEAGVRAGLPLWKVYPDVHDSLLDVNGLAHKINFYAEALAAGSNVDFDELVPYDLVDDTSDYQSRVRTLVRDVSRGMVLNETLPDRSGRVIGTFDGRPIFDERYWAIYEGATRSPELADDLQVVRLGAKQRLQTKRGMPDNQQIVDWMVLDVWTSLFPDPDRDNYGETVGPVEYDYEWNLGGRTTLVSSGAYEFWTNSVDWVHVGFLFERPQRGQFSIGHTWIRSVDSSILTVGWSYQLNQKWRVSLSEQVDFGEDEDLGSSISLTRRGRDWIWSFGVTYSPTQDNTSVFIQVTPVLLPKARIGVR